MDSGTNNIMKINQSTLAFIAAISVSPIAYFKRVHIEKLSTLDTSEEIMFSLSEFGGDYGLI
jgi:hypothetical protein